MKKTIILFLLLIKGLCLNSQTLSDTYYKRLLSFCELYSTVKFYYPDPDLANFPWDYFAYQGYIIAKTSKNDKEFIKKTDSIFHTIAPGVQIIKKQFDISRITPKDTLLYSQKAFWQHQAGLNVEEASFTNASTLNYIYGKPTSEYMLVQMLSARPLGLLNKKIRISLMAKVEGNTDSVKICSFNVALSRAKGSSTTRISTSGFSTMRSGVGGISWVNIYVSGNEWKRYEVELDHSDSVISSRLAIYHPKKGTLYVDDLKIERFENGDWEEVELSNSGFESYSSSGGVGSWEKMYIFRNLVYADSIHTVEGKYCLKLPAVEENLFYPPVAMDKPYMVSLPKGYKAYVPLQLYADESRVYPSIPKEEIDNFTEKIKQESLTKKRVVYYLRYSNLGSIVS